MVKAKVIRGVYVKGVPCGEGAVVELSHQEFNELRASNYVVEHMDAPADAPVVVPGPAAEAPETKRGGR